MRLVFLYFGSLSFTDKPYNGRLDSHWYFGSVGLLGLSTLTHQFYLTK